MITRRIKSKKEKQMQVFDLIFFFICLIVTIIRVKIKQNTNLISMAVFDFTVIKNINLIFAIFVFLFDIVINIIINSFFLIIIYIPIRLSRRKVLKENLRYEVIDNIEYFRDKFKDISPAEISLISDLEVENKKDISATLLKLYTNGYIEFNNNEVTVINNTDTGNLKTSEKELLNCLKDGDLSLIDKENWKHICIEEAIHDNYIKSNNSIKKKKHFWISTVLLLISIFVIYQSVSYFIHDCDIEKIEQIIGTHLDNQYNNELYNNVSSMSDEELQELYKNNPQIIIDIIKSLRNLIQIKEIKVFFIEIIGMIISINMLWIIPIYKIIRSITYGSIESSNRYERTNQGKILAEQIAAMQRYIHEFSLLSDKEKEYIKLWDEFLVYAVVLEENEKIIDDIFSYKNISRSNFF